MAVCIPLSKGAVALIDQCDADRVRQFRWSLWERGNHRYAVTSLPREGAAQRRPTVGMHRLIMGEPAGLSIDHIDGNGLNNTRENLRVVSRGQNRSNSVKRATAASAFKGVYQFQTRFRAQISCDTLPVSPWYIGSFSTAVDAAQAYDACARILFGEHARLNFPRHGERGALITPPPPPSARTPPHDARLAARRA